MTDGACGPRPCLVASLRGLLALLVFGQVLFGLVATGRYVLFGSELRLLAERRRPADTRLEFLRGQESELARSLARDIPPGAGVLVVCERPPWILNYYLLPRRLFRFRDLTRAADIPGLPPALFRAKGIDFVLWQGPEGVRLWRLDPSRKAG